MRELPSTRVNRAVRPIALADFPRQNGREPTSGVVVALAIAGRKTSSPDSSLRQLEAENAELRRQVVELALAIQALKG